MTNDKIDNIIINSCKLYKRELNMFECIANIRAYQHKNLIHMSEMTECLKWLENNTDDYKERGIYTTLKLIWEWEWDNE